MEEFSKELTRIVSGMAFMFTIIMCVNLYKQRKKSGVTQLLFWVFAALNLMFVKDIVFLVLYDCQIIKFWDSVAHTETIIELFPLPLMMAFNFRLVAPKSITNLRIWLMFIPFLLLAILNSVFNSDTLYFFSLMYAILFSLSCICFIFLAVARYKRFLKNNYSNMENITVDWVQIVTVIYFFWFVLWAIVFGFSDNWWLNFIYYIVYIILWTIIYRYSVRHRVLEDKPETFSLQRDKISFTSFDPRPAALMNKIYSYFELKKPFLNPDFSINDLAITLKSNRTYISHAINTEAKISFYKLVNRYRVLYAIELLNAGGIEKYTLETFAKQSGFNSMSTFYSFFKEETGCTPKSYIKK